MTRMRHGYVVYALTRIHAATSLSTVNPGMTICRQRAFRSSTLPSRMLIWKALLFPVQLLKAEESKLSSCTMIEKALT